jgi:TorA maturation chaperone TorD
MYFLAFEEANSGDAVWHSRQARFWRDHLGQWLPRLAHQIGTEAGDSRYYVDLAMLAATFSDWVGAQLGGPETTPAN